MKVAVGSTNPIKLQSVKEAFEKVWPEKNWDFLPSDVKSGISDQPMTFTETIKGATTRAKKAIQLHDADFGVGLEGGLEKIGKDWFDAGWLIVIDKNGIKGIGSTINMHVPPKMMRLINKGIELGLVNDIIFKEKILSKGPVTSVI